MTKDPAVLLSHILEGIRWLESYAADDGRTLLEDH